MAKAEGEVRRGESLRGNKGKFSNIPKLKGEIPGGVAV